MGALLCSALWYSYILTVMAERANNIIVAISVWNSCYFSFMHWPVWHFLFIEAHTWYVHDRFSNKNLQVSFREHELCAPVLLLINMYEPHIHRINAGDCIFVNDKFYCFFFILVKSSMNTGSWIVLPNDLDTCTLAIVLDFDRYPLENVALPACIHAWCILIITVTS